jgi:adenylate cyclase
MRILYAGNSRRRGRRQLTSGDGALPVGVLVRPTGFQRRLAAILAADVAGYSRLIAAEEGGTLAQLKADRREAVDPAGHRGRIVKLMGDELLVEFGSVVDAVECAAAVQRGMAARNAGLPMDRRMVLRIGVHLGDVIVDEGDIFGDGVNIAARLEGLAEPGGIALSGDVHNAVRGKVELTFEDLGERRLKTLPRRFVSTGCRRSRSTAPRRGQI